MIEKNLEGYWGIILKPHNEIDTKLNKMNQKFTRDDFTLIALGDIQYKIGNTYKAEWFSSRNLKT